MNDIRPVKRQIPQPTSETPAAVVRNTPPDYNAEPSPVPTAPITPDPKPRRSKRRWVAYTLLTMSAAIILAVIGVVWWYKHELRPNSTDTNTAKVRIVIERGMTPDEIGTKLADAHLIRSQAAFTIYIRLHHVRDKLQAGTYNLSPAVSTPDIVEDLTSGHVDQFTVTFLPGATVAENKQRLEKAGYSSDEVNAAFDEHYDHPLFATKPNSSGLEGYIFGDTYTFPAGATAEDVLMRIFDEYYQFIQKYDLIAQYKQQELTLYQGIILASIIQREVSSKVANEPSSDQRQVAQVFLKRLRQGTVLGSDVTYKYAAKVFGLPDDPSQNSKYNTRKVSGLPPGPIATPGGGALRAVANPAPGKYLYFLAGDDGKTYFAYTNEQHESNIKNHCKINCSE